jgi:hypothetical protein
MPGAPWSHDARPSQTRTQAYTSHPRHVQPGDPMTWTKHPDDYADQLWSLSDAAYRLHCSATVFSNRTLTDGYVPADRVRSLVPHFRAAACVSFSTPADGRRLMVDTPSRTSPRISEAGRTC